MPQRKKKTSKPALPSPYKERLQRLKRSLKKQDIDGALITNRTDYRYLTGFTGEDSAVLVTPKTVMAISDGRFEVALAQEASWMETTMRSGLLDHEIARVCQSMGLTRVGFQSRHVSVASLASIKKKSRSTKFSPLDSTLLDMRKVKDDLEMRTLRKAVKIAEASFLALREQLRIGDTEQQIAARLEFEMKSRGADGISFPTIVAEGPNAALPHAHPGRRKIKKGSALLIDWGARVNGYCSDLTRVLFVGSIPAKIGEVYQTVLTAQLRAIKAVKAGAPLSSVDAAARGFIADAGYASRFNHGLGHGLGLDVHESPRISWQSDDPLHAGEVVTIEPGIYLPGVGGVRIEDDVLVTRTGCRVLSKLSKSLDDAVVKIGRR
ncbi:MAG: M24 family metallopeptidase [Phycisphaerae bacterium]